MQNTSKSSPRNGRNESSGGKLVLVIVAIMLICFVAKDANWGAIDTILGLGFIVFLFVRWISSQDYMETEYIIIHSQAYTVWFLCIRYLFLMNYHLINDII